MSLNALASATLVAMVLTSAFILLARSRSVADRFFYRRSPFAGKILYEAGHRLRAGLKRVDERYATGFAALVFFVLAFAAALMLRPNGWLDFAHTWLQLFICLLLLIALACALYRFMAVWKLRRTIVLERDAHIAIGHGLQRVLGDANRVFHHVAGGKLGKQSIDHVIVGPQGVYAVHVVARRAQRSDGSDTAVTLNGNELVFGDSPVRVPITDISVRVGLLARELSELAEQPVRIRSAIAVPGWHIREQNSDRHLLINENLLAMIRGWTDSKCFLMNDQVAAIARNLGERCINLRP